MTPDLPTHLRSLATAPAHEAAAEIERLTAELANAEWRCRSIDAQWMREVERLRRLVARKNVALATAAGMVYGVLHCGGALQKKQHDWLTAEADATEPLP